MQNTMNAENMTFTMRGIWWVGHNPSRELACVTPDGDVLVWNDKLGQFSANHSAGKSLIQRCRALARTMSGRNDAYGPVKGRKKK